MNPFHFLRERISRLFHTRRSNNQADPRLAWPEAKLFEQGKQEFEKTRLEYNSIISELIASPYTQHNELAFKYQNKALAIIYVAKTRADDFEELMEYRRELFELIAKLQDER